MSPITPHPVPSPTRPSRPRRPRPLPQDTASPHEPPTLRFTDRDRHDVPRISLTPGELTLVEGQAGTEAMRHRLVIDCARRGGSVLHLVGGARLDSAGLARRAQAQGLDPEYVLHASSIARGFTAHQFSVLLEERLPAHLGHDPTTKAALILDPLALYTDEDVRPRQSTRLTEHAIASLRETADEHARPLVLVQPLQPSRRPSPRRRDASSGPSPQRVAKLLSMLRRSVDEHVRVITHEGSLPDKTSARIIELPDRSRRVRVADPSDSQARLDRFVAEDGIAHG